MSCYSSRSAVYEGIGGGSVAFCGGVVIGFWLCGLFRVLASEGRRRIGREGKKKIREKEENKIIFKRIFLNIS